MAESAPIPRQGRVGCFGGAACTSTTAPGVGSCAYFNPFGSALTGTGTRNTPELIDWLLDAESFNAHNELVSVESFASRQFGELGGGPIGMAVGAQYRGEQLKYDYNDNANRDNYLFLIGNPDFGDDRDIDALFVELALPFSETLNLQFAGYVFLFDRWWNPAVEDQAINRAMAHRRHLRHGADVRADTPHPDAGLLLGHRANHEMSDLPCTQHLPVLLDRLTGLAHGRPDQGPQTLSIAHALIVDLADDVAFPQPGSGGGPALHDLAHHRRAPGTGDADALKQGGI